MQRLVDALPTGLGIFLKSVHLTVSVLALAPLELTSRGEPG